jgi:signal transduction histidine kinase
MRRPWQIWLCFAGCLLVAVAAVAWLSYRALESERAELTASARADLEENARLALWRIDSAVAALIAQENARPYFAYRTFYSIGQPQGKNAAGKARPAALTPSPLLSAENPQIKLYFEFDTAGQLTSPRVPAPDELKRAVPQFISQEQVDRSRTLQQELAGLVGEPQVLALLPPVVHSPPDEPVAANQPVLTQQGYANNSLQTQNRLNGNADVEQQAAAQQARGAYEYQARSQALANTANFQPVAGNALQPGDGQTSVMTPLWVDHQLLLARQVELGGRSMVQGCWLDWPVLREDLLASVRDLLPDADLLAGDPSDEQQRSHMMAALPVRLVTGELPPIDAGMLTPVRLSLLITWGSLLLAALAVALLLSGVMTLSERRAAFVSAVTHELRTPLTTFRMYAEMLAEGMVPDEESRRRYLQTLRTEADRLTHLVENVLAYARIERGGPGARIGPVPVVDLLDRASERLGGRAAEAGFDVLIEVAPDVQDVQAVADPTAVEQILFNLVDNACKYARSAEVRTLELDVTRSNGHVRLQLTDHGPGVAERERKRLFQPFRKSAGDAAHSAPGVGLGLALSQRLARDMGGDLSLESRGTAGGACFVLTLKAEGAEGMRG